MMSYSPVTHLFVAPTCHRVTMSGRQVRLRRVEMHHEYHGANEQANLSSGLAPSVPPTSHGLSPPIPTTWESPIFEWNWSGFHAIQSANASDGQSDDRVQCVADSSKSFCRPHLLITRVATLRTSTTSHSMLRRPLCPSCLSAADYSKSSGRSKIQWWPVHGRSPRTLPKEDLQMKIIKHAQGCIAPPRRLVGTRPQ
jgi:hypothetical protein